MSTVKTTYLQHPSSPTANIILNADGSITADAVAPSDTIGLILILGG